jgi:hypothetical protein
MSAVAIVGAPGAGAAPEPTATLEVGSPGTVDFAFDPNGNEDVLPALVLLEAPATCPNPLTELPGSGYFAGGDPTVLAFTVESGDIVLDLGRDRLACPGAHHHDGRPDHDHHARHTGDPSLHRLTIRAGHSAG